jgi:hypothetical protein
MELADAPSGSYEALADLERGQGQLSTPCMRFFVVVPQKIFTPVVPQISPDRMDMVRIVLGIVILDKKTGSMG